MAPGRTGRGDVADAPETLLRKGILHFQIPLQSRQQPHRAGVFILIFQKVHNWPEDELEAERAGILRQVAITPQASCWLRGRARLLLQFLLADAGPGPLLAVSPQGLC